MSFDFESVAIAVVATLMAFAAAMPLIAIVYIVRDAARWATQGPEGVVIADQGDDWSPFPSSVREIKAGRATVLLRPHWFSFVIGIRESQPVWHSAVGVELAGREVGI